MSHAADCVIIEEINIMEVLSWYIISLCGNSKRRLRRERKRGSKKRWHKSLVGKVPGLLTVQFVEEPMSSSTHDVALVTTLEKASDIAAYAVHPEHVRGADDYVRPYVTERACLDYE